jgi:hypothetical protein
MVVAPTPLLAADRKDRDRLRRRVVFEVPEHGASKVIERRLFDIDPTRGIVSRGERDEAGQPGPSTGSQRELELPRWLAAGVSWRSYGIEHRVQGLADLDVEAGSFHECVVIDAKNAHTLPGGARTDLRSFYCPDVGEAAALVMVGGAWRPAMELESWVSPQAADTKLDTPGAR